MVVASLLSLVACTDVGVGGQEVCGSAGESEAWCPIDACAMQCQSPEAGATCCIDAHGFGLDGADLDTLLSECIEEQCDPDLYISAESALCIGQVNGIGSGVGWCGAGFTMNGGEPTWIVMNTTRDDCATEDVEAGTMGGDGVELNARTGAVLGFATIMGTAECPEH